MSGILRLESLTKGNTLKQGDKTPLKYRLFDADGEKLNIAGKSAKVRLVYPDFLTIGYEKEGLTVAQDDTVTFTIDSIIPSRIYHVEIIVDDQFIFPSRADESKFTVDKSSLGAEANIIEIVGVDRIVNTVLGRVDADISQAVTDINATNEAIQQAEQERVQGYQEIQQLIEDGALDAIPADGSITREKLANNSVSQTEIDANLITSPNILDSSSLTAGQYMYGDVGAEVTQRGGANWSGKLQAIPVKVGDVVRFNLAYQGTYFVGVNDQNIVLQIGPVRATAGDREIIVEAGVTKFYTTVFNQYVSEAMITINQPMPDTYTPFGIGDKKKLQWLEVDENNLSVTLQDKINSPSTGGGSSSNWTGARMITAGDSITWQDGRAYAGTTDIARGWQTIVKEKLGLNSVNNIAVSGRPMSDGSTNGAGTVTTILGLLEITEDLFVIASGTNDFKLNIDIGTLQTIGSTFDRNTFYGAYQTSLEHIINLNPSVKIVLFTPLHRNNGGYNSTGFVNTAGHTLDDYRQAIFKLGELYSLPVIDMFAESGINLLTLSVDTRDGLHPNDNGYLKMGLKASVGINNA